MSATVLTRGSPEQRGHELEAGLSRLLGGRSLPPGTWLLSTPDQPAEQWQVDVGADGPRALAVLDTPRAVGALGKLACVALAWLLERGARPDRPLLFSWAELGLAIGGRRPSAETIDGLRRATAMLTHPLISHERLELGAHARGPRWPRPAMVSFLDGRATILHQREDPHPGHGQKRSLAQPGSELWPQLAAGAWRAPSDQLLRAGSDLARRVLLFAPAATLVPPVDGSAAATFATAPLLEALGVRDSRAERARRRLDEALEYLVATDPRYAASRITADAVELRRRIG